MATIRKRSIRAWFGRLPAGGQESGPRARADQADRPIVVAYVANPEISTSVCLIGYHVAAGMIDLTHADVIVHRRDRDAMLRVLPADRLTFVGPTALGNTIRRIAERLFPGRWGLISLFDLPDYVLFDISSLLAVRRISRQRRVPYVLRVNPVSFRFPSLLPYQSVPVVTGPHNGGLDWPPGFAHLAAVEGDATGHVRKGGDLLHRIYRDTDRYARILVANEQCAGTVPATDEDKILIVAENGVPHPEEPSEHAGDARRLLLVARLNPFKVVDIALRALARLPDDVRLTIVGDGPQGPDLRDLAGELGIAHRVRFVGHIPHAEVARHYAEAGVFIFPSVRESGGGVILEAMSHGLPCVVADWGGPAVYTREAGIRCRVDNQQVLEDDLVAAVQRLLADPAQARAMGAAAREVVAHEYVWQEKIQRIDAIAREAAGNRVPRKIDR